jgi:hypothetical protein
VKRSGPPIRRKRLAPRSAKRIAEAPARRAVVEAVVERDGHWCQAATLVPEVKCWPSPFAVDADEYALRSARPGGHLDPANVQMLCRAHHDWKHLHPIEAARVGLRPAPPRGLDG